MEWIDVHEALPEDGDVVLIYTNKTNVHGRGGRLMREHVATFCKGRTHAEVEASGRQEFADECGNNRRPFRWDGNGPCAWWGQDVTHWAWIVPPNAELPGPAGVRAE